MSMVVKNNLAAQLVLGQLNKNSSKLEKELSKVSSGQKINSAKDDASGYAISEKMREQIRSLEQDNQNVQNGSSMLKIAEGGVDSIVEELRNLKELALNAANDHNTTQDRVTIQKEFSQKMANINDIATTTNYNGKTLLDGTYSLMIPVGKDVRIISEIVGYQPTQISYTKTSVTKNRLVDGNVAIRTNNNNPDIAKNFFAIDDSITTYKKEDYEDVSGWSNPLKSARGAIYGDVAFRGKDSGGWNYAKAMNQAKNSYYTDLTLTEAFTNVHSGSYYYDHWQNGDVGQIGVSMDFSLDSSTTAADLDGEGFSILCHDCKQYINIVFDANKDNGDSSYTLVKGDNNRCNYVIGIQDIASFDNDTLSEAIFNGVRAAHSNSAANAASNYLSDMKYTTYDVNNSSTSVTEIVVTSLDSWHDVNVALNPQYDSSDPSKGSKYIFTKSCYPNMIFMSEGIMVGIDDENSLPKGVNERMIYIDSVTTETVVETVNTPIYSYTYEEYDVYAPEGRPIIIHQGTESNQHTNFYINDMHTKSLGNEELFLDDKTIPEDERFLKEEDRDRYWALNYDKKQQLAWLETVKVASGKTLDDIDVKTKQNANIAVRVLDGAIDYALEESTRLGAYLQRLDYTDSNIVTMNENVQAAESTVRDADMAREMSEYTKANVLLQAAQSMLAQANQNSSAVLSLLQ